MWNDLPNEWKTAFEEGWEAFRAGSTPIGAALFDQNGKLVLKDHNRANEAGTVNRRVSHAEANLLRRLDTGKADPKKMTLYTTMEPCPMCMGTAVMSHIRHLRSAARDPYCGMMHLASTEDYYVSKGLDFTFEYGDAELVQLTVQSYYELKKIEENGVSPKVLNAFRSVCPQGHEIAVRLFESRRLDALAAENTPFGEVFDLIISMKTGGE